MLRKTGITYESSLMACHLKRRKFSSDGERQCAVAKIDVTRGLMSHFEALFHSEFYDRV